MHVLKRRVIWCHAVVLQVRNDLHAILGLILLGQGDGNLLGAVVSEVEENHHVTFLDASVNSRVDDGLDELVGHPFVIGFLDGTHHVVTLLADTSCQHIIGHLDAVPVVVAVHRIVATNDCRNGSSALLAMLGNGIDKAFAAFGVGVTTIHEAVNKHFLQTIILGDVTQRHQVLL